MKVISVVFERTNEVEGLQEDRQIIRADTSLAEAINYTLSQWGKLTAYLEHPQTRIDNNLTEQSIRPCEPDKGDERCVVKGDWKLILSTVREPELYHLPSDSSETNNRWTESKDSESVSQLKAALAAWGKRTRDSLTPKLLSEL
jgi:hypothetical protein